MCYTDGMAEAVHCNFFERVVVVHSGEMRLSEDIHCNFLHLNFNKMGHSGNDIISGIDNSTLTNHAQAQNTTVFDTL